MDKAPAEADALFHAGELAAQTRQGVRDRVETIARRSVRDHMPDQHREFYAKLPFLIVGSVDAAGRPWASIVPGRPGFVTTPDARTLDIAARPLFGDPLTRTLRPATDLGILGIELETRRRNRANGRVAAAGPDGFTLSVTQAFGNCPQYIQSRDVEILPAIDRPGADRPVTQAHRLDAAARALSAGADTLFIASAIGDSSAPGGVDVSHRGGRPGFVRVEDDRTLAFPDFSGNNYFNTVGNLVQNPRAGLLFIDFAGGDLLYLTGAAGIVWEGEEVSAFAGAERLIRFVLDELIRVEASLPLRFAFGEFSPTLERTGSWQPAP